MEPMINGASQNGSASVPQPPVNSENLHYQVAGSTTSDDTSKVCEYHDPNTFKPIHVIGVRENSSEGKWVSGAVLLPCSTCMRKKDHSVSVVSNGKYSEVSVVWPRAMCDLEYLHKHWLDNEPAFLRLISFRMFLRKLRKKKDRPIVYKCRIKLPFRVKEELYITRKNTSHLIWDSDEVVLYVALEATDMNNEGEEDEKVLYLRA